MNTQIPIVRFHSKIILLLATIFISGCISHENILENLNHSVYSRSCSTVSQAWLNELRLLASEEYSTPVLNLQISAVERISDSTFVYHPPSELSGKQPLDITGFLLLVSDDDFEGNVVGYYDPTTLSFCTSPLDTYFIVDDIGTLIQSTLGIIGVDSDSF